MSLSNTSTNNNGRNSVPSERLWLRSELMGTQVITTDTGRRLGVVGEVVVDIDRREVVALGLRDNPLTRFLPGLPKWMPLESIKQVGDVILVDSLDSLSDGFSPERYGKVINCQVITESGQLLGRVLGFSFDIETGGLISLVMGAVGVPLLGEGVLSTWEIPVDEIVSSGTDRIIVYEGAEEKLNQLSSGLLEKLGVGGSSWEEREANRYTANLVPVENQLLSGSESEEQNNFMEEIKEEEFIEEEEYEEELEYVEIETTKEKINNKKQLYLDNDSSEQLDNQTIEENTTEFAVQRPSISNRASKRPIQRSQEPLDIEPVEEKKTVIENPQSESVEIDDPW
ncbi:PRC-barrel domain-containing protein [uncultured Prochlorococcus sp.]|jgi:sporulation protein YlmC with PRC-barrel domain|uniref:PRC-barrel domain-containing protein n=1 Tax=Prochlorococcus sp. TaxID=1220 RepID=UPI00258862B6|nr:PRC-barrel domain-containing protein [uncultured Prochlorococcus sp.]